MGVVMKGKLVAISMIIIVALAALYNYMLFDVGYNLWIVSLLFISPLAWWLGNRYDTLQQNNEKLKHDTEKLEKNIQRLEQKNKDYELLVNSLEGVIFSFDIESNNIYLSKGAFQIFGYSNEAFSANPNLWKEIIHPDDIDQVEKDEKLLLMGQPTSVEYRVIHPENEEKWVSKRSTPIQNEDGDGAVVRVNGYIIDITERKLIDSQLKQMAFFDDLTDLPNRKSLDRHIKKALARSKRHNHNLTLMFIDLDDFKVVNDTMGHEAGDTLLKEVVDRVNHSIREEDLLARIGGDEFVVVFEETTKDEIEGIAQRIVDTVSLPYMIDEKEANISLSIGISMYPDDGEDKGTLIEHADQAMYFAKNNGKNNYKMYTAELSEMEFGKGGLFERWKNAFQKSKLFNL
jgi:diguanylate cyclase (GGDEF)-like protein/PAS domain S-box-containing protein